MSISSIKLLTKLIGSFLTGLELGLALGGILSVLGAVLICGFVILLGIIDTNLKESNV